MPDINHRGDGVIINLWNGGETKTKHKLIQKPHDPPGMQNSLSIYSQAWNKAAIYRPVSHSCATYVQGNWIICISWGGCAQLRTSQTAPDGQIAYNF